MSEVVQSRIHRIETKLKEALEPSQLEVIDDSAHHIGHSGASQGAGHYTVIVESNRFSGLTPIKRHQLVYSALNDMIPNEIHALQIRAFAPGESA